MFLGENNIYNNNHKQINRLTAVLVYGFLQIVALLSKLWILLASEVLFLSSNMLTV